MTFTTTGAIFTQIVQSICWKKGWGVTATTEMFPDSSVDPCRKELDYLVANGYLFHYRRTVTNRKRNWRYRYREGDFYGITKKGWAIAGKYLDAAGIELQYMYDYLPHRPV